MPQTRQKERKKSTRRVIPALVVVPSLVVCYMVGRTHQMQYEYMNQVSELEHKERLIGIPDDHHHHHLFGGNKDQINGADRFDKSLKGDSSVQILNARTGEQSIRGYDSPAENKSSAEGATSRINEKVNNLPVEVRNRWWKKYIPELSKAWPYQPRGATWCTEQIEDGMSETRKLPSAGIKIDGLIYIKLYKASSSTCEGVALNIANRIGQTNLGPNKRCVAHTRHEFAEKNLHAARSDSSLMYSFVRHPQKRDMSHVFHFEIGRYDRISDGSSRSMIDHIDKNLKNFQTRFLVPETGNWQREEWQNPDISYVRKWPRTAVRNEPKELVQYLNKKLFSKYDFLGVTERMDESLAVMVLLWNLKPADVIVLNSKRSGGYDDGGHNNRCTKIPKAFTTVAIEAYMKHQHSTENVDYLLYDVANHRLNMTITSLGPEKVERVVAEIRQLTKIAESECLSTTIFPCSPEGVFQPDASKWSCFIQDAGCGHKCVADALVNRSFEL